MAVAERRTPLRLLYVRRPSRRVVLPTQRAGGPGPAARTDDLPAHCGAAGDEAPACRRVVLSRGRPRWRGDRDRGACEHPLRAGTARPRPRHGRPARHGRLEPAECPRGYVRGGDASAVTAYLRACLARLHADPRLYTTSRPPPTWRPSGARSGTGRSISTAPRTRDARAGVARRYPRSVQSVVLDSASLPGVRIYDISARNAERALEAVFARCAAARACARAYPSSAPAAARAARPPGTPGHAFDREGAAPTSTTSPGRSTGCPRRPKVPRRSPSA